MSHIDTKRIRTVWVQFSRTASLRTSLLRTGSWSGRLWSVGASHPTPFLGLLTTTVIRSGPFSRDTTFIVSSFPCLLIIAQNEIHPSWSRLQICPKPPPWSLEPTDVLMCPWIHWVQGVHHLLSGQASLGPVPAPPSMFRSWICPPPMLRSWICSFRVWKSQTSFLKANSLHSLTQPFLLDSKCPND